MKKITFLALHLGYGGVEQATINEANLLADLYEVQIISVYKITENLPFYLDPRVNLIYLSDLKPNKDKFLNALNAKEIGKIFSEGIKSLYILFIKRRNLTKCLQSIKTDILISTRYYISKVISSHYYGNAILLAREHRHHNNDKRYIKKLSYVIKRFNYFLPVSKELAVFYSNEFSSLDIKTVYLPNFIQNMSDFTLKEINHNLIAVGRLSIEKGFVYMVSIINKLKNYFPDIKLNIIGDGRERKIIETEINNFECEENITLHGFQNRVYLNKQYEKSSIYIMTSLEEALPFVIIEAQTFGIPCIAYTSAQGANELIHDCKDGFLIPDRNEDLYVKKIIELLQNEAMYHRMSRNAYENSTRYSAKAIRVLWEKIINS